MTRLFIAMALALATTACGSPQEKIVYVDRPVAAPVQQAANTIRLPLFMRGGTPHAMIGLCAPEKCWDFPFTVDSGASDVTVDASLFRAMVQSGLVTQRDLINVQSYQTASGIVQGLRFRMPPMRVGGYVVNNVVGSVSAEHPKHVLLLGQSFLRKFRSWSVDNRTGELLLAM